MNLIASVFITISVLFDVGVWYFVKDLVVFDDEKADDNNAVDSVSLENILEPQVNSKKLEVAKENH